MEIKHHEMVATLAKRGEAIKEEMSPMQNHLLHMAVGISGEIAELIIPIYLHYSTSKVDRKNLLEELGDVEFYLEGLRQGLGLSREDTIKDLPEEPDNHFNMVYYLVMFGGDVLDTIKKACIYQKEVGVEDIVLVLSKLEFWLEVVRTFFAISHQDTLDANIDKLGERYKGFVYSNEAAHARADKQ